MLVNYKERKLTSIPEEILGNKLITNLNLEDNQITYLPVWFTSLTGLKVLYLSNNQISDISLLAKMPSLELIYMNHNKIRKLPEDIGNLKQLRRLYLGHNQLEYLPDSFYELTELRMLILKANKLTSLDDKIGQLKHLVNLDAGKNQLSELPAGIGQCRELKQLKVNRNKLASLPWQMKDLDALEDLNVARNQLTTIGSLPATIKVLHIEGNPVQHADVRVDKLTFDQTQADQVARLGGTHEQVSLEGRIISPAMLEAIARRNEWNERHGLKKEKYPEEDDED
ncbi:leucine-rich repeat domain-containing protein [Chitinophaga silvisoli]|uniref:Leucine-rich repeat domain-containing protein n=1 Tax=Chitinophaga silvisoli TaxID=2291814 RepID=A0A3E1NWR9_9BACT|nr:leucine-rich repeat domain-containing protein [Chitinophaga silvisoli]RFM32376.1 leucine-rich repeat domain-containing protein [Chitinophaga silvisoli]